VNRAKLLEIKFVDGLIAGEPVEVLSVIEEGEGLCLIFFRRSTGETGSSYLSQEEISKLTPSTNAPRSGFSADPDDFKLAMEALRMKMAGLFDPLVAINSSDLDPLPHQIRAVYNEFLPRVPLRFLLADDPGAGKTIMAGLYIKELILRGYLKRCLIVVPGGLLDQWRQELSEKFSLNFETITKSDLDGADLVNPFEAKNFVIARMDQLSRSNPVVEGALDSSIWDLIIVDEAHRMSAHYASWRGEPKQTKRFKLGKRLSKLTTNFLLMTATPHAGNDENFQLFLSLLDEDRFEGKARSGSHRIDTSGLMRRLVKENLVTLEGKALFPERKAQTVEYSLSSHEQELYDEVTSYVREEMNRAQKISEAGDKKRGNNVGFALTILQRRLASSPRAILRSLERREEKLRSWLMNLEASVASASFAQSLYLPGLIELDEEDDIYDEFTAGELEEAEENQNLDLVTAAETLDELKAELTTLSRLTNKARSVHALQDDKKWTQLRSILVDELEGIDEPASERKFIVFTEHKDTLQYLKERMSNLFGNSDAVVSIHGGHSRQERNRAKESFTQDPAVRVLVATDAAGEGLNLQRAHLMVNYDLPWNPNRIEQRFGRIHRIGQTEVCWLWNMIAAGTREGEVFKTLLGKIEQQSTAYNGNLFNVLGQGAPFSEKSLKLLLIEAIRYGNDPAVQARRDEVIDEGIAAGLQELQAERALFDVVQSPFDPSGVAKEFEARQIRRLQPGFIAGFFRPAFERLTGNLKARENGRYEITKVPEHLTSLANRNLEIGPVASAYERVTFDRQNVRLEGSPNAYLIAPGSALMTAVVEKTLADLSHALLEGTILIDRSNKQANYPIVLFSVLQEVSNSTNPPLVVDRHFDFIEVGDKGEVSIANTAPYIDYSTPSAEELEYIRRTLMPNLSFLQMESTARKHSVAKMMQEEFPSLKTRVSKQVERIRAQVEERLDQEISYWYGKALEFNLVEAKDSAKKPEVATKKAIDLEQRKKARLAELLLEESLVIGIPKTIAAALVIPESMMPIGSHVQRSKDQEAMREVERRAVDLVLRTEIARGKDPQEQARNNKGFDIISRGRDGKSIFIEVKGRIEGSDTFLATASELSFGQTQGANHLLALVMVSSKGADFDEFRYVSDAFANLTVDARIASVNLDWKQFWRVGFEPLAEREEASN